MFRHCDRRLAALAGILLTTGLVLLWSHQLRGSVLVLSVEIGQKIGEEKSSPPEDIYRARSKALDRFCENRDLAKKEEEMEKKKLITGTNKD